MLILLSGWDKLDHSLPFSSLAFLLLLSHSILVVLLLLYIHRLFFFFSFWHLSIVLWHMFVGTFGQVTQCVMETQTINMPWQICLSLIKID